MSDLSRKISNWRTQISQKEILKETDIDELEVHLREQIEQLQDSELSEDESFLVAIHRLGDPELLSSEYKKINGAYLWRRKISLLILGYIGVLFGVNLINIISNGILYVSTLFYTNASANLLTRHVSKASIFACILFLGYLIFRDKKSTSILF